MPTQRGPVMINTGHGKGKTTAALGAVLRAAGRGLKVLVLQFLKEPGDYGELAGVGFLPGAEIRTRGLGLIEDGDDQGPHRAAAARAWREARREVLSGGWDLVVLDELCVALHFGFVPTEEVVELMHAKPPALILFITGRYCPEELFAHADTVTRMQAVKHHLGAGLESQPGVEY
jgi:cob(I)alamin adenosyltransferase